MARAYTMTEAAMRQRRDAAQKHSAESTVPRLVAKLARCRDAEERLSEEVAAEVAMLFTLRNLIRFEPFRTQFEQFKPCTNPAK